ncbi:MAG: HAMP domain-containing protein [Chloroflexi bacterium]|nr:HAMP domain-containing protein [Chloroflexota bacterium]
MKPLSRWLSRNILRTRIALAMVGLTLGLGVVALFQATLDLTTILEEELRNRGIAIARDLAARSATPSQTNDVFSLFEVVNDGLLNNRDVRYILLVEPSGTVRVHTFQGGVPPGLASAHPWEPGSPQSVRLLRTSEGAILDIAVPVLGGQGGVIRVGLSEAGVRSRVGNYIGLLSLLVGMAIVGAVGLSVVVSSLLTRPLTRIAEAARRVGSGDLTTKLPAGGSDELGDLARAFNSMTEDLVRSRESLIQRNTELEILTKELERKERVRAELLEKLIGAQEEERRRIAREIHDEPTQALSGVLLQLDKVLQHLAQHSQDGWKEVERVRQRVRGAMESLQQITTELRPHAVDDLGFVPAIRWFAEQRLADCGVRVDFSVVGRADRLPPPIEIAAFRITQEAINNVARHAEAASARIELRFTSAGLCGRIEDDGKGFDPQAATALPIEGPGLGLLGMQERAVLLGGSFAVSSQPGKGTAVSFDIPLLERRLGDGQPNQGAHR